MRKFLKDFISMLSPPKWGSMLDAAAPLSAEPVSLYRNIFYREVWICTACNKALYQSNPHVRTIADGILPDTVECGCLKPVAANFIPVTVRSDTSL